MRKIIIILLMSLPLLAFSQSKAEKKQLSLADNLAKNAEILNENGDYHAAKMKQLDAVDLYIDLLHTGDIKKLQAINDLAIYCFNDDDLQHALNFGKKVIDMYEIGNYSSNTFYGELLSNFLLYCETAEDFVNAETYSRKLLTLIEKDKGTNNNEYADNLDDLAYYCFENGRRYDAYQISLSAFNIKKNIGDSIGCIETILNIYDYALDGNHYDVAELYINKALEIVEKLGLKNEYTFYVYSRKASSCSDYDDYQSAIKYSSEALNLTATLKDIDTEEYGLELNNLGVYYSAIGNYTKSIDLFEKSLTLLDTSSTDYTNTMSNLGINYMNVEQCDKAVAYCKEAFIRENAKPNASQDVIIPMLTHLAQAQQATGDIDAAFETASNAFDRLTIDTVVAYGINIPQFNADYGDVLTLLYVFATLTNNYGLYEKSASLFEKMMTACNTVYGKNNSYYICSLQNISYAYLHTTEKNKVIDYSTECYRLQNNYVLNNFATMNTNERGMFWSKNNTFFGNDLLMSAAYTNYDTLKIYAYDGQLFSKGLTLNAELEIQKLIEKSGNKQMKEKYLKIRTDRALLDKLYQMPVSKRTINADSLQNEIEKNEKELVASSKEIGDYTKNLSITWQSVQNKLKDNDIAIEFGQFYDDDNSLTTIALVLKKGMSSPELVKLDFTETDSINYKTSKLYNHIWKPLEKYLAGVKNVYFSPCGKFHTIGIEYLPDENGEIFAKKFNAYRLSSTRELALEKKINPNKKASVYGGILYDFSEGDWQDLKYYKDEIEQEFRDIPDLSGSFRAGVTFLQGAKVESETITEILRNGNYQVSDWAETYATEESFKKLSGSGIKMLHIATHGFYEPESKQNSFTDYLSGSKNNKEDLSLSRSGLLLAGAASAIDPEKRKQIPEGVDDGILTAKEISRLDFKGLDLVVLSACQTGLGEVTGEGVFGLQRGFKKAGAQTIVMSLWKVDDNATKDLMTEFYKNLVQGKSKREAFVLAQDFVRQKYQDPQKWAAFIMVDGL
ncbi:MAG: CHAT domain-containing protein [Bacteroidales bacterium]|nr:CHAT domain-containing protein [Bacteroidales bacterium]